MNKIHVITIALTLFSGLGIVLIAMVWTSSGESYVDMESPCRIKGPEVRNAEGLGSLRFCVATMWSPKETFSRYRKLGEGIGRLMGVDQTFTIHSSYREVREALESGAVDVALVCTGTLAQLASSDSVDVLVMPRFLDGWEYRGNILVPVESSLHSLSDLEGRTMAMTDPESLTGCIMPTALLYSLTPDPQTFLSRVVFTGSHDRAVEAVAAGLVDSAAVNELIYHSICSEDQRIKAGTRVLWRSEAYGPPPVLVPRGLSGIVKKKLRSVFLGLHKDGEGYAILRSLGIKKYELPPEGDYDTAADLFRKIQTAGGCPWP